LVRLSSEDFEFLNGYEIVLLLDVTKACSGSKVALEIVTQISKDRDTILHFLAKLRDCDGLLSFMDWIIFMDSKFAEEILSFGDARKRNFLHYVFEKASPDYCLKFLEFLLKQFSPRAVKALLNKTSNGIKAYPLLLFVYNGFRSVKWPDLSVMLNFLTKSFGFGFIKRQLITMRDSDNYSVAHYFVRFCKYPEDLQNFLLWIIKNVDVRNARNLLSEQVNPDTSFLTLISNNFKDSTKLMKVLNDLCEWNCSEFMAKILLQISSKKINCLLLTIDHNSLDEFSAILNWCLLKYGQSTGQTLFKNMLVTLQFAVVERFEEGKLELDYILYFLEWLVSSVGFDAFRSFAIAATVEQKTLFHLVGIRVASFQAFKKLINLFLANFDALLVQNFLQVQDVEGMTFIHHFCVNFWSADDLLSLLDWLLTNFNVGFLEKLFLTLNKVGFTPLAIVAYNENPGSTKSLVKLVYWIDNYLTTARFKRILDERTALNWSLFDLVARYKDDTESLIEILEFCERKFGKNYRTEIFAENRTNKWTILHYICRYNSKVENVKMLLMWVKKKFGVQFLEKLILEDRGLTALHCFIYNMQISINEIFNFLSVETTQDFLINSLNSMFKECNFLFIHELLEFRTLDEIRLMLRWLKNANCKLLSLMLDSKDSSGKMAVDYARMRGPAYEKLLKSSI
jgi:hypothetical protein